MVKFYHGSNLLFENFDIKYGKDGYIYVSPCKNMSLSYIPRSGGYLYTIELDESNTNYHLSKEYGNDKCLCRAYHNGGWFKDCERREDRIWWEASVQD